MKLGTLILVTLLAPSLSIGQSVGSPADRLSGQWTGDLGQDENRRRPIVVDMKVNADGTITGKVTGPPQPGEIRTGIFDPKTGSIKFAVDVQDGRNSRFDFDGMVVMGMAVGRVTSDGESGDFRLTKSATTAAAAGNNEPAAMQKAFTQVSGWVSTAASRVPAERYTFKPTASVRTFGQQIAHIIDSYHYYCAQGAGRNVEWSDPVEKGPTDKATLSTKLAQATAACTSAYSPSGKTSPLLENIAHTNLHYGNIITYMRMMGLVPPSS